MEETHEVTIFDSDKFGQVRVVMLDSEPWFVGKDVCDSLELTNSRRSIKNSVDDGDKQTLKLQREANGAHDMVVINESGVYALIFASRTPRARAFKHWVTSEVLPSIRKTGAYQTADQMEKQQTAVELMDHFIGKRSRFFYDARNLCRHTPMTYIAAEEMFRSFMQDKQRDFQSLYHITFEEFTDCIWDGQRAYSSLNKAILIK